MVRHDAHTYYRWVIRAPGDGVADSGVVHRPGYGKANPNNGASIEYNKNICMQTTRWAIVEWLQDEHRDGIWGVRPNHAISARTVFTNALAVALVYRGTGGYRVPLLDAP